MDRVAKAGSVDSVWWRVGVYLLADAMRTKRIKLTDAASMNLHNTMTPDERDAFNRHLNERERRSRAARCYTAQLTAEDIIDLKMLRQELLRYQPGSHYKCDRARDAVRYLELVEKLIAAVPCNAELSEQPPKNL